MLDSMILVLEPLIEAAHQLSEAHGHPAVHQTTVQALFAVQL